MSHQTSKLYLAFGQIKPFCKIEHQINSVNFIKSIHFLFIELVGLCVTIPMNNQHLPGVERATISCLWLTWYLCSCDYIPLWNTEALCGNRFLGVIRGPSFISVSLMSLWHLKRAQQQHLASQVCCLLLLPLCWYLTAKKKRGKKSKVAERGMASGYRMHPLTPDRHQSPCFPPPHTLSHCRKRGGKRERRSKMVFLCCLSSCLTSSSPDGVHSLHPMPVTASFRSLWLWFHSLLEGLASISPMLFRSLVVDVATNPLHPTSPGSTWVHQPCRSASTANCVYFRNLRS